MTLTRCSVCNKQIDAMGLPRHMQMHRDNARLAKGKQPAAKYEIRLTITVDGTKKFYTDQEVTDLICRYIKSDVGAYKPESVEAKIELIPRQ